MAKIKIIRLDMYSGSQHSRGKMSARTSRALEEKWIECRWDPDRQIRYNVMRFLRTAPKLGGDPSQAWKTDHEALGPAIADAVYAACLFC
jgi:hypothetical protein